MGSEEERDGYLLHRVGKKSMTDSRLHGASTVNEGINISERARVAGRRGMIVQTTMIVTIREPFVLGRL